MRSIAIIFGVVAIAVLTALVSESRNGEVLVARLSEPFEIPAPTDTSPSRPKQETSAGEVVTTFDRLTYGDYLIETRYRMAKLDVPPEYSSPPEPVKVSSVVVRYRGKLIAKFGGHIYFSLGNNTEAGFFPLLGKSSQQLIISQDTFRTGVQWVADFSNGFKVIFDGRKFRVGREGDDMTISDLDADGVYEITVPMTAFYGFERWRMTTGSTPLPDVIFKYDPRRREYLPANPKFKEFLVNEVKATDLITKSEDQQTSLGHLMSVVLDYVLVGEEERGWKIFEEACQLPDKAAIKRDVQKVLEGHPVYRYVYKKRANR